jgi:hypothetical protein
MKGILLSVRPVTRENLSKQRGRLERSPAVAKSAPSRYNKNPIGTA